MEQNLEKRKPSAKKYLSKSLENPPEKSSSINNSGPSGKPPPKIIQSIYFSSDCDFANFLRFLKNYKFSKKMKKRQTRELHKKRHNFAPGAADHTFF